MCVGSNGAHRRSPPENIHDAYQATLLSSANSFSCSKDLALEVGEVLRHLEEEKSTWVIYKQDTRVSAEETWSYDDRGSSSPLHCRNCMMIGLCSWVVQMLICTGGRGVALYKSWHSKYHPKPSWLYSSLPGITCGRVILLMILFPRNAQAVSNSTLRFDIWYFSLVPRGWS